MKAHVGTDRRGIVHSLVTTAANESDISQMGQLLHGSEREVYGDQAYWSEAHRQAALSRGIRSATRARCHVFHVVKNLWGFTKVRYRGLATLHHVRDLGSVRVGN
jgi:IS5 family transposase